MSLGYYQFLTEMEGKCCRWVMLTTLLPLHAYCLEICEPQSPGTFGACLGLHRNSFIFTCSLKYPKYLSFHMHRTEDT